MSDGGPPDQGLLRLPQSHSTGDCDGHLDKRLYVVGGYAKGNTAGRRQRRKRVAREGQSSPIDGVVREVRATEEPEIIRGLRSGSSGSGT